ncbi:hypothetical protein SG34_007095 [Thalassomonas viridans]|uniref:Uncharacterized protein n=1 Tax=Thalassomonas viridans TaxID=137584 RepID=A0AAE9Z4L6_9GAMM|nr:hypothetical protein [Thalassomonas viridans]WDE06666.1 hypothetical protein SG34_007095 [Thalassomonas viridans]
MAKSWYEMTDQEQRDSRARPFFKMANDRTRLEYALRQVLSSMSLAGEQTDNLIADVKSADFSSLNQLLTK